MERDLGPLARIRTLAWASAVYMLLRRQSVAR
jgi:hypothetical protein